MIIYLICPFLDGIKYNQSLPYASEVPSHFDDRKGLGSIFTFESVPKMNRSFKVELKIWDDDNMLALHIVFNIGRIETKTSGTNAYIVTTASTTLQYKFIHIHFQ